MAPTGLLPERIAALTGDRPPIVVRPARLAVSAAAFALVILLALAVPSGTPLPRLLPVHLVHPVPVHPVRGGGRDRPAFAPKSSSRPVDRPGGNDYRPVVV